MAYITERVHPAKVYQVNELTGEKTLLSGSSATSSSSGTWSWNAQALPSVSNALIFDFDFKNNAHATTRFVSIVGLYPLKMYLNSIGASGSGALVSGSFAGITNSGTAEQACGNWVRDDDDIGFFIADGGWNPRSWQRRFSDYVAGQFNGFDYAAILARAGVESNNMGLPIYSNVDYTYSAAFNVQLTGENQPYMDVNWCECKPTISCASPATGAFVDEHVTNVFAWNYSIPSTTSGYAPKVTGGTLHWRAAGETSWNDIALTNYTSCSVPANTLSGDSIEWYVSLTTDLGAVGESATQTVSTVDATPLAPTIVAPQNQAVDNNAAVLMSWVHNISTGSPQGGAELAYSTDNGGDWTTFATTTNDAQSYTAAANTLPAGSILWRVRTSNTDATYGPWSGAAEIIVRSSPTPATISSVTNTPRPTISWQQSEQKGCRVIFKQAGQVVYDTGEQYGTAKSAKCKKYCEPGEVTIIVMVVNAIGLWSSTTTAVTVANIDPIAITLRAQPAHSAMALSWDTDGSFDAFYVLRDGVPIAKTDEASYTDRATSGRHSYQILGVQGSADDYYCRSQALSCVCAVKSAVLYDVETGGDFVYLLKHRDSPPVLGHEIGAVMQYQTFAGRSYPVAFDTGARSDQAAYEYTVLHDQVDAIEDLVGKLVCVKEYTGKSMFAILESVSENEWKRNDVSLTLTRVDHNEEVAYD